MLKVVTGDIVTEAYPIFCHQVNCRGVMGAGLAKQIRSEYPEVYHEYKYVCSNGNAVLGKIQPVETSDDRICINMYAQYSYGRDRQYTNYDAFKKCLDAVKAFVSSPQIGLKMSYFEKKEVAFPMYIGCGLAGGDWNKIRPMLEAFADSIEWDVVLVRKE